MAWPHEYRSPICKNCGRDKQLVAKHLINPDYNLAEVAGPMWLHMPYCYECFDKHCLEFNDAEASTTPHWQCQNIRPVEKMGQHPAVYQDYCPHHLEERSVCHRSHCKNQKPAWDTLCPKHRADADRQLAKHLIAGWQKRGLLCDDCRQARQNSPQRYCKACLDKRGIAHWVPATGPWRELVKSWVVVPPDGPQEPQWISKLQDEKAAFDPAERRSLYERRRYAKRVGKPLPPLPPRRTSPPKIKPAPKRTETKYRRQFWTGSTTED